MTNPTALGHLIGRNLNAIYHGVTEHHEAAAREISDQVEDAYSFFLVSMALATASALTLRATAPACPHCDGSKGTHEPIATFDANGMPEGPQLQAMRTVIAVTNRDHDMAKALINVYASEPSSAGAEFVYALIGMAVSFHQAACDEVHR